MRVCILSIAAPAHGIGGINDHTRSLAAGLAGAGHAVEVVTARHPQGIELEEADGVVWRYADAPPFRHLDPTWLHRSWEAFARAQATTPFDVVHGQGSSALELLRRGVHKSVPVVTMFHGNFLTHARAGIARARAEPGVRSYLAEAKGIAYLTFRNHLPQGNWYRFRSCEAIVPSHAQLVPTCRSHLLRRSHVHVVPNGVDATLFRPRPREELRRRLGLGSGPLLVTVARLNRGKGVHHALRALALLPKDTHLAIVGDGGEREPLERLARELGLVDRVRFTGSLPPEGVADHMAAADVILFPTLFPEAAPLVLVQALASGAPTVASALGAIPEVVGADAEAAVLVPAGDPGAIAAEAKRLLADPAWATRVGEAARRRVLDGGYTLEAMVARTVGVYELARERRAGNRRSVERVEADASAERA